jgi:glycine/D-amino acid oxidase-like deaminating enzyme/nitrite reductase/ring-hydroxylating ferredoxin subunit
MGGAGRGTTSVWADTALPHFPPLERDTTTDVCIVGAGIAGLSAAYEVVSRGRSVVVLDDGGIGSGETGRTTAHLATAIDDRYSTITRYHGAHGAALAAESHAAAIARIEQIIAAERIDCGFERVDGYLIPGPNHDADFLREERHAAAMAGLRDTELLERAPETGFPPGPCLRFRGQAQFHPLGYIAGLADAIVRRRGRIHCGTHVTDVADGEPVRIETASGRTVLATDAVVATDTPINDRFTIHTKQAPYRTYVVAALVPRGAIAHALLWDTADPYHYARLAPAPDGAGVSPQDFLIVGGEDHKTGQDSAAPEDRFRRLEQWMRARFPMAGPVDFRWSGQVLEPVDGVAFIGLNPGDRHTYVHTGDSGMGMTHGVLGGMLNADLIAGRTNRWAPLYDPARRTLRAAEEFLKENLNVAVQYGDWVSPGDVHDADRIPPGEGAVVRAGLHKVAVYRAPDGALHASSAACTHLGCVVRWNAAEKSWDCPCHGSRFDPLGAVLNGPAVSPLTPADLPSHT